jgi:8-oxo-dGTP pyrophosphatase MutT (NUDIX family)
MSTSRSYPQRRPLGHGRVAAGTAPVKPRDAGSLIIWRAGSEGAEVLMGRRSRRAAFVPDFFVFPGGRLDPADRAVRPATPLHAEFVPRMGVRGDAALAEALALAAVRETFEETGLLLAEIGDIGLSADAIAHPEWAHWKARDLAPGLHRLRYFGRAITSPASPIRFHARFFVARAQEFRGDIAGSGELTELAFYPATEVLANMPVVDVTEFMLNRIIAYAADPLRFDPRMPIFSYRDDGPFVRYE